MEQKLPVYAVKISSFIFKYILISALMILTNLPLAFSLTFVPIQANNFLFLILLTVTFFPSLVAMNYALWEKIEPLHEIRLAKRFFRGYKMNFVRSWLYSLLFTVIFFVLGFDYQYVTVHTQFIYFKYLIMFVAFILFLILIFMATFLSRFDLKLKGLLVDSLYLMATNLIKALTVGILVIGLFILASGIHFSILQFFIWGIVPYLCYGLGRGALETYMLKVEKNKKADSLKQ